MKNHLKTLLITFTLIIGLCGSMLVTPASAAKTPVNRLFGSTYYLDHLKLNTNNILFYVGGIYDLKLENVAAKTVKWTSSNKSIATVNASGRVTAKKVGKCTITANYKGMQYKCTANVLTDSGFLNNWCKMLAKQIKTKNKSPYDQVLASTAYVAKYFRYGSAKTPLDVIKKGRGTCVSANKLLVEILKAAGFKAYLRYAAKDSMSRYPRGMMFMSDHHNVRVVINGKNYFVDGTPATGAFYMTTSTKPIYYEIYYYNQVRIDYVPGHKNHFNLQ